MATLPKPSLETLKGQAPGPGSAATGSGHSSHGFGNGFSRAFEFAATPAIFGVIGYFVDRWLGTTPFLTIGLTLFAVVGVFLKLWLDYDATMKVEEAKTLAARRAADERHTARVQSEFSEFSEFAI